MHMTVVGLKPRQIFRENTHREQTAVRRAVYSPFTITTAVKQNHLSVLEMVVRLTAGHNIFPSFRTDRTGYRRMSDGAQ